MKWLDKEEKYLRVYRQGREAKDIWKYIPDRLSGAVTNAFSDQEGYWVWLDHEEGGWVAYDGGEDCGVIHEYSIADLKGAIKTIRQHK